MNPLNDPWQRKWLRLDVTHPKVQSSAAAAAQFCRNWIQQTPAPGLLFMGGPTGTGKSHLAEAVMDYCRQSTHLALRNTPPGRANTLSVASYRWPELANEFRERNFSVLPDLFETDLVLLDDVGAEDDPFKVVVDKLCQVLSRRERRFTVLTSNILPPEFSAVDPRLSDRLLRNSRVVDFTGVPSYAEHLRLRRRTPVAA